MGSASFKTVCMLMFFTSSCVNSSEFDLNALPIPIENSSELEHALNRGMSPGIYDVAIVLNGEDVGEHAVHFASINNSVKPCIDSNKLDSLGLNSSNVELEFYSNGCLRIKPGLISFEYDEYKMSLELAVSPILRLNDFQRNIKLLDDGINSLRLNYDASSHFTRSIDTPKSNSNSFLSLSALGNLNDWRVKANAQVSGGQGGPVSFLNQEGYAYKTLVENKSTVSIGRKFTQQDLFDTRHFSGFEYASEPRLYSREEYGPVQSIPLILLDNAVVRFYQNKIKIYESYLFAGSHNITNYVPQSNSDIDVEIENDNGVKNVIIVRNNFKYSESQKTSHYFSGGVVSGSNERGFLSAIYRHSITDKLSFAYGFDFSNEDSALGISGNYSVTVDDAINVKLINSDREKYVDIKYSKQFSDQESFLNAEYRVNFGIHDHAYSNNESISRASLSVYNPVPGLNLSVNVGITRDSYFSGEHDTQGFFGINGANGRFNYSVNYMRTLSNTVGNNAFRNKNDAVGLSLYLPLDISGGGSLVFSKVFGAQGNNTSISVNGADKTKAWNTVVNMQDSTSNISIGGAGTYHSGVSELSAYLTKTPSNNSVRVASKGAVMLSEHGVKLSEKISETVMLVHTPGVEGVGYTNDPYELSDRDGYAIIDNIQPYTKSSATINNSMLPSDVEAQTLNTYGVASKGAVLYREIKLNKGRPLIITVENQDSIRIPLGASVTVSGYNYPLISEGNGQIFIPALPDNAKDIAVEWGNVKCSIVIDHKKINKEFDVGEYAAPCYIK